MPKIIRHSKNTLSAIEMNLDESLEFIRTNGSITTIKILSYHADVTSTTLKEILIPEKGGRTQYKFWVHFQIDGEQLMVEREVSTQKSFYEPISINGLWLWLDAVDKIFTFLKENHGDCKPKKNVRFGLIENHFGRICPETLAPWCDLPKNGLKIEDCFRGEDCWLGAYDGVEAHGGLDINHPAGSNLYAPIDIENHYYFNSLVMGHNNNRWRAHHRFKNGSEWIIQSHHLITLLIPEHQPITKGTLYAKTAGVYVGKIDHTHFVFKIYDYGDIIFLDPWILFWQMYRDLPNVKV